MGVYGHTYRTNRQMDRGDQRITMSPNTLLKKHGDKYYRACRVN